MQQETFIIGSQEFSCVRMNPFEANRILIRLQKIAAPIIGSLMSSGENKSIGDIDVKEAALAISEQLDEAVMDTIVLPMFAESKVYCIDKKQFVKNGSDINKCFTTENLIDLYVLIFEVGRYQFCPFFEGLMGRFGNLLDVKKTPQSSPEN